MHEKTQPPPVTPTSPNSLSPQRSQMPENTKFASQSAMDAHQLIDSLTSHISLYHLSSPNPNPNPNPNPRSAILRWFSSLPLDQRQSHLTTVDRSFVRILLSMEAKLRSHGHGSFFLLPDLPSPDRRSLPSICFRKSQGLLSRVSDRDGSGRSVSESVRLFSSREGEDVKECCCSEEGLDSMTVCEGFVEDVDRFVAVMDGVSNGGFLRGEEGGLGGDWVEMKWLKAKGYYSVEAFVSNRIEIALRLAWLNCNGGKKRGLKVKEKVSAASVGVAVNVFRRKKGCIDWWDRLDGASKRRVFSFVLGKSAKALTAEIQKGANDAMGDEMRIFSGGVEQPLRFNSTVSSQGIVAAPSANSEVGTIVIPATASGKLTPLSNAINSLVVLQEILTILSSCQHGEFNKEKLFFSTLGSVSTISDCVQRKLRGFLMVVSLDCTKLELLGEKNLKSSQNKLKGGVGAGKRRKKGRTRNIKKGNDAPTFRQDDLMHSEGQECGLAQAENEAFLAGISMGCMSQGEDVQRETFSSIAQMEHAKGLVNENTQTAARKNRRRTKNKHCDLSEKKNVETRTSKVPSSSGASQGETTKSGYESGSSVVQNIPNDNSTCSTIHESCPSSCNSVHETIWKDDIEQSIDGGDFVVDTSERSCRPGSLCDQPVNSMIENQTVSSTSENGSHAGFECGYLTNRVIKNGIISTGSETLSCVADCNVLSHVKPVMEEDSVVRNGSIASCDSGELNESEARSSLSVNPVKAIDSEKTVPLQGGESGNLCDSRSRSSTECPSYEWPSVGCVAPAHFSSVNSHFPAATDRLHLDVGHNWHNHFHQAFVPALHQARNPQTEGSHSRILSQKLPMSLDWPPMVRSTSGLAPSLTHNYDSGFVSRKQSSYWQGFAANGLQLSAIAPEAERKHPGDSVAVADLPNTQEITDEYDSHWLSEEEFEMCAVSGVDYSQYFGGGVMYWNSSDHPGTGFSRPPSLSSDDSSWAWPEADINRAVDDMVAFSSSYSTNGLTSPTATPFCSSFDSLGPGHQALGFVMPANEVTGKVLHSASTTSDSVAEEKGSGSLASLSCDVEGKTGDSLPYPVLRPIIIPNISRERSRSEFRHSHEHKSPCVPPTRRERPRIKRPPSPVVLCVPRPPCPPLPSPASDSRKHKGFPTVRSGSSSPRHWGMRGWYQDGSNFEEACVCVDGTEVVWPWRNKNLSARPIIQPLPGTLLRDHLMAISQLTRDQEHPDVAFPLQTDDLANCPTRKAALSLMHSLLHDEIDSFCKRVAAGNMIRKPYINWAVKRVTRSLQVLWPRSRTNIFGSNATGLSLPTSDVDLVVCLPPVRNLEPIKEAGILEGRNGIKETCLQHAARYLANQEWVKNDSLKTVENTAIPIIRLVVQVPRDHITPSASNMHTRKARLTQVTNECEEHIDIDVVGLDNPILPKCSEINYNNGNDLEAIRLDISFKSLSHTGLQTTDLVKELTEQFPAATPLALVLKKFLADRSLDQSYSGGLSSYCLVLLVIRFLQHEHHLGRPINQNYGGLLMDFLYFFGNVFDPRQMRISVQGSGVYINRERGHSIDPIHIDDPLFPTNNVGRNCFRIHQCIKAFSDAFAVLESELTCLTGEGDSNVKSLHRILRKIVPSIDNL